jgi:hypothetical protein
MIARRLLLGTLMGLLGAIMVGSSALGVGATYATTLSGANEVPPVMTPATGEAIFTLSPDGTTLTYRLTVANITDVMASHIHLAPTGVNGPVVVGLFGGPAKVGSFTGVLNEGVITAEAFGGTLFGMSMDALIAQMNAGTAYVNVHTMAHPGGEIRGQIAIQMAP